MLTIKCSHPLAATEAALLQAAQRRGVNVLSVIHLGRLLREMEPTPGRDAIVFTVCRPDLSAALLAEEIRLATFIPCRITAIESGGEVTLEAPAPAEFCRWIGRPDLESKAAPLQTFLLEMMQEAARPLEGVLTRAETPDLGLGATETMVNARAAIPQRVDCHGTKIEEIAGTGQHDAPGG